MNFNYYFVVIPAVIATAWLFGNIKVNKTLLFFISMAAGVFCGGMILCESRLGMLQLFDMINRFDSHPVYSSIEALIVSFLLGVAIAIICYKLSTRKTSHKKKAKKQKRSDRADYGDLNQIAYGKSITVQELVPVLLCK